MKRAHLLRIHPRLNTIISLAQREPGTFDLDFVTRPAGACNSIKRPHTTNAFHGTFFALKQRKPNTISADRMNRKPKKSTTSLLKCRFR